MSKHRTVNVYKNIWDPESRKNIKEYYASGIFHQFGSDVIEDSEESASYSVAIVELADGEIITPQANMIKFTLPIEFDVDAIAKKIATEFYRHWHNAPGTNTDQGFDDWWTANRARILSEDKS